VTHSGPLPRESHTFNMSFSAVYESGLPAGHLVVIESKEVRVATSDAIECGSARHVNTELMTKRVMDHAGTRICLHCAEVVSKELFLASWMHDGKTPFAMIDQGTHNRRKHEALNSVKAQLDVGGLPYVGPYDSVVRAADGSLCGQTCMACKSTCIWSSVCLEDEAHVCLSCIKLYDLPSVHESSDDEESDDTESSSSSGADTDTDTESSSSESSSSSSSSGADTDTDTELSSKLTRRVDRHHRRTMGIH
jgi:hypothetical protein